MRIHELLSEAISLTKHEADFEKAIARAVVDGLRDIRSLRDTRDFQQFRDQVDQDGSFKPLWAKIGQRLYVSLGHHLTTNFQDVTEKLYPGSYVPIDFVQTNDRGYAKGMSVFLSDRFLSDLTKIVLNKFYDAVTNSFSEGSLYDYFFGQYNNKYIIRDILSYADRTIEELLDVVIHELVHVVQHGTQLAKGKHDYEYRSYLSDPKKKKGKDPEFMRLARMRTKHKRLPASAEARYRVLHASSPQEMGAYSHNIAQSIIRDFGLNDIHISPADIPPMSDFSTIIADYVKSYITPKTPAEQRIFQRYAKMVTLEITRYLDYTREKFKGVDLAV